MASYSDDLSNSYGSNGASDDRNVYYDTPIEQLRGGAPSPIFYEHLFRSFVPRVVEHDRSFEEEPSPFELVRRLRVPMEQRRRIPGCGINHFAINDTPVRAETSPIPLEEIFRQGSRVRTYARPVPSRPAHRYGVTTRRQVVQQQQRPLMGHSSITLESSESLRQEHQQRQRQGIRDPCFPFYTGSFSPYIFSSSSSSSASSSPLLE